MRLWTYNEVETKVRTDLDLLDVDNMIVASEMVGYANEAIEDAEGEILKLSEDYFLSAETPLTWVNGTASYSLPSDIYAQKIRSIVYSNGNKIYPIRRLKDPNLSLKQIEMNYIPTNEEERMYFIENGTAGVQAKMVFVPTPQESGAYVKYRYIRSAQRIPLIGEIVNGVTTTRTIQLATILDIPEWTQYIIQFMKVRCYEKERDARLPLATAALADRKKAMIDALTQKTPDNEDQIPMDMDFYEDFN